jgi:hypothetical protein
MRFDDLHNGEHIFQAEGSAQDFFSGLILPIRQFLLHKLLQSGESAGCIVRKLLDAA